jgi:hypothetical protein
LVNRFVSRASLILVLFIVGFTGRAVYAQTTSTAESAAFKSAPAVPASRGVLYDGNFPAYAAVVVTHNVQVRATPDNDASAIGLYNNTNADGAPQTFLITGQQMSDGQPDWYQVLLPVRPNGTRGWLRAADVQVEGMPWRVDVHLKSFKIDLYKDGVWLQEYPIGTGTNATPTPDGEYSINELLKPPTNNTIYGSLVLGLSGYSDVETDWPGGGHLAIHGTNDPATTIGHEVSHGCVRLRNQDIQTLAGELPLGTPVQITDD